jgi:hypothetical protein
MFFNYEHDICFGNILDKLKTGRSITKTSLSKLIVLPPHPTLVLQHGRICMRSLGISL